MRRLALHPLRPPVFNPAGAVRAEKFAQFQQRVSARQTVARIEGDKPVISYVESGKIDQLGNPIQNNVALIKKSGISQIGVPAYVRKALTHFTKFD